MMHGLTNLKSGILRRNY